MRKVLIIGGYGSFGGRLARLLAETCGLTLMIAGRSLHRAEAFVSRFRSHADLVPARFDRNADALTQMAALAPDLVIDASGPFQAYGEHPYRVVEAAIACSASYLDLADAAEFVCGVERLDAAARAKGVFALAGASTAPALTCAVARHLATGLTELRAIAGGIAPSPFANVGPSVIEAVACSAGRPLLLTRDAATASAHAFTDARRSTIAPPGHLPLKSRVFSLADVPDLRLLARVFPGIESAWMGAAPAPAVFHSVLRCLARLVRGGYLDSIECLAPAMRFVMQHFAWGEHRGGMFVEVTGKRPDGRLVRRSWHLVAEGDDGPFIPAMAAAAIAHNCLNGRVPQSGARPACDELALADFASFFEARDIHTGRRECDPRNPAPVFQTLLGSAWPALPQAVRNLHAATRIAHFHGRASVTRGTSWVARIVATLAGFPTVADDVPLHVTMAPGEHGEQWTRDFGGQAFGSRMSAGTGRHANLLCEHFGPVTIVMALVVRDDRLHYVQRGWTLFGIPMPGFLGPMGQTFESADAGRFRFHVDINLPIGGHIVGYDGWLAPGPVGA